MTWNSESQHSPKHGKDWSRLGMPVDDLLGVDVGHSREEAFDTADYANQKPLTFFQHPTLLFLLYRY